MTRSGFAAGVVAAVLTAGCASAPARWSSAPAPAPSPDRWERAACQAGEYPQELDARALARARHEDLRARRDGSWSSFAAARLESERDAFDARCAAWRAARADSGI
jgi:hypothetical protein